MWDLKTNTDELIYNSQIKKANLWLPKWKEKGINRYTLCYAMLSRFSRVQLRVTP